jgi:hypothetical protein
MNERIRELAEQAKLFTGWPTGQVEYQKFAELIIQECATFIDSAFDIDEHSGEVVSYADGSQLKEHFGIES